MYAVIFNSTSSTAHQYGQFTKPDDARTWGRLEADGQNVIVIARTQRY